MNGEIKVNFDELDRIQKKLSELNRNVQNRKVGVSFSVSKGNVPEKLVLADQNLMEVGKALATLVASTEAIVADAKVLFKEADGTIK